MLQTVRQRRSQESFLLHHQLDCVIRSLKMNQFSITKTLFMLSLTPDLVGSSFTNR